MEQLKNNFDVDIAWRSFELRPAGTPPASPEYRARIEAGRERFEQLVATHFGLKIDSGPFGIVTRSALIGAKYAEAQNRGQEYHRIVQNAYWLEAKDISNLDILKDLAVQAGLDADGFTAALNDPDYDLQVEADIQIAWSSGINGVPATVIAQHYLLSGAQPYEVLARVIRRVQAEQADQV